MSVRNVLDDIQKVVDKGEGKPNDLIQKARSLLDKHGDDAAALIAQLMGENYDLRVERRDLKEKLPKEGAVVLSAEDVAKWEALKGYDPADVKKKLGERDAFEGDLKKASRQQILTDAAALNKMNPLVLQQLAGDSLVVEITGESDKKSAVVKDDKGVPTPLADYAKAHWGAFAASLGADPATSTGAPWVPQPSGGSQGQPTNLVDDMIKRNQERAKAPNALTATTTKG